MAEIDDLKTEVSLLITSFSAELKAIEDKLAQPNPDAADVAAATAALSSLRSKVDAETAKLTATA